MKQCVSFLRNFEEINFWIFGTNTPLIIPTLDGLNVTHNTNYFRCVKGCGAWYGMLFEFRYFRSSNFSNSFGSLKTRSYAMSLTVSFYDALGRKCSVSVYDVFIVQRSQSERVINRFNVSLNSVPVLSATRF